MNSFGFAPVVIAGNGQKQSLFSTSLADSLGFHSSLGSVGMGQRTPERWYSEAREEVVEYDDLLMRARKIANRQVAAALADRYTTEPIVHRRDTVARQVSLSDQTTGPTKYENFRRADVIGDVQELKDYNSDFKDDVQSAELTYGSVPEPIVIERERVVTVPGAPAPTPNWVLPAVLVGGGIAVAALLGVFK